MFKTVHIRETYRVFSGVLVTIQYNDYNYDEAPAVIKKFNPYTNTHDTEQTNVYRAKQIRNILQAQTR